MRQYALYDHLINDLWSVDGNAVITSSVDMIAFYWCNFERHSPGRYEIIGADV